MSDADVPTVYLAACGLCLAGAAVYFGGLLAGGGRALVAGLVLVGIGQTASIVDAVLRY